MESVNLLHYVDIRFSDLDSAIKTALESLNQRLAGMNELRAQFVDLLPRAEFEARLVDIIHQLETLKVLVAANRADLIPRAEFDARCSDITNQLDTVKTTVATSQGHQTGTSTTWTFILGLGGFLVGCITVTIIAIVGHL
jgi:hypothetical protein